MLTQPVAQELSLAVYTEAIQAGAFVYVINQLPGAREALLKLGNELQLDYIHDPLRILYEEYDALLTIWADENTRELAGVDPARQQRQRRAGSQFEPEVLRAHGARGEPAGAGRLTQPRPTPRKPT